nr:DUF262 domain-containing protein [Nonomuraea wenchangensis]
MKANETTLRKLIQGDQQLLVPLYQRQYTWERPQLTQLWTDITAQVDVLAEQRQDAPSHFMGSVVLAPGPELAPSRSQWIIVDGQQRLTTLMLALCAIRDHLVAEEPSARERINELHLINKFQQGELRYRLLPTQSDRAAFKACVDGTSDGRSDSLVGNAYQFFRSMLKEFDDPADPHDIARVESVLLDRLNLVQILVEKDDNAFRIFESINNTGMRLSQVDLIRNYVFMCLPTRGQHVYDEYWKPIQDQLDAKAMEQLMYLVLVLREGGEAQYNAVYRGHQQLLLTLSGDESQVEAYVQDLHRRARHLSQILFPSEDLPFAGRLRFLKEWQASTAYPLIMRLLELREDDHIGDEEVSEALTYVESFLVRRLIAGVTTGNLNRIFQRLAVQLVAEEDVPQAVRTALSPARLYWPSDAQLREEIRSRAFYWQGRTVQQKLILRRIEESLGSKERVDLADKRITIEQRPAAVHDRRLAERALPRGRRRRSPASAARAHAGQSHAQRLQLGAEQQLLRRQAPSVGSERTGHEPGDRRLRALGQGRDPGPRRPDRRPRDRHLAGARGIRPRERGLPRLDAVAQRRGGPARRHLDLVLGCRRADRLASGARRRPSGDCPRAQRAPGPQQVRAGLREFPLDRP